MSLALQRGAHWESRAEHYLRKNGLKLLQRNFRCRLGEIDLVMRDGETLVFVEVRFRSTSRYGSGAESITARKRQRLIRAAGIYLHCYPNCAKLPCRFDVLSIGEDHLDWIQAAFSVDS